MRNVVSISDFTRAKVEQLIDLAETLRGETRQDLRSRLRGALVATLFYEPSTRTRLSFEAAVTRLGGNIVGAENAKENSSAKKGETLADVFRVVGSYADAIVIRHYESNAIANAVSFSPVPVVNAGAGSGEHPTQSLLDVYTLWREFGHIDGLSLTIVGDLKYGRTVHSLLRMLTLFQNVSVTVVHPDSLALPDTLLSEVGSKLTLQREDNLDKALAQADVVYQTRVQKERLVHAKEAAETDKYAISGQHLGLMQKGARILHPLPRVNEIAVEVDDDNRAAYFRQVENGLYIRMALMDEILGGVVR
jgi:aspartate carbamoyltransferase catalytic subunit